MKKLVYVRSDDIYTDEHVILLNTALREGMTPPTDGPYVTAVTMNTAIDWMTEHHPDMYELEV
jgi:hypothetical protein